jgi:hypothetical protein
VRVFVVFALLLGMGIFKAEAVEMVVCAKVTEDGEPLGVTSRFEMNELKFTVYFFVEDENGYGSEKAVFKLYRLENGREILDNTFSMDTKTDWTWFWKSITFSKPGKFKVYTYKSGNELISTKEFELYRKVTNYVGVGLKLKKDSLTNYIRVWGLLEDIYKESITSIFNTEEHLDAGDLITKIGDKSTQYLTLDECISLLKGPEVVGSVIVVKAIDLEGKEKSVTLKRQDIAVTLDSRYIEYFETKEDGDICTQVNNALKEYPSGFKNMKGPELPPTAFQLLDTDYYATVMPDGAISARINESMNGKSAWVVSLFETFNEEEAMRKYKSVAKELSECKIPVCGFVSNSLDDSETMKTTYFLPFGFPNPIPKGYDDVYLEVMYLSMPTFDLNAGGSKNKYSISLKVGPQP